VYEAVSDRTRAVVGVHLFGRPLDWEALQAAVPPDVALVEDAAGALGARWRGMPCGGLGVIGCLSFHPRKVVTTGEGGAVTTSDADLADAVRASRHHGIVPHGSFDIADPSTNYRLSDLQCAIGLTQLARLDELLAARRRVADAYTELLSGVVETPSLDEGDEHGWQAYVVAVDRRDEVLDGLRAQGIEAQIGTYALHRLSAYRDGRAFPGADAAFERALALPLHSRLMERDIAHVAEALTTLVSKQ
jgi:dTDP-4-amino-4,6-dideoxygalactose transaminase